jgi:hypothetical protein
MVARTEAITLTFPCEPRFVAVVKDAVATAVRNIGRAATQADTTASAVERFLESCLAESVRSPIAVRITNTEVHVDVAPRTLRLAL